MVAPWKLTVLATILALETACSGPAPSSGGDTAGDDDDVADTDVACEDSDDDGVCDDDDLCPRRG